MFRRLRQLVAPRKLDVPEAYREWARDYPSHAHNALMEIEEEAMLRLLPSAAGLRALDLACGSGRYLKKLEAAPAQRIWGIDLSEAMLQSAREITPNLIQADVRALPLRSDAFDLVICGLAVGHLECLEDFLKEVARVLAPGGLLVYSDLHPFATYLGWKRTFETAAGGVREVPYFPHLYSDHHRLCRQAGLEIEDVLEPRIGFEHPFKDWPAVIALRVRRVA